MIMWNQNPTDGNLPLEQNACSWDGVTWSRNLSSIDLACWWSYEGVVVVIHFLLAMNTEPTGTANVVSFKLKIFAF